MTESIYAKFYTVNQIVAAAAELEERGVRPENIIIDPTGLSLTVVTGSASGVAVRAIIEQHGGSTEVSEISDPGAIPEDPLEYSDDSAGPA